MTKVSRQYNAVELNCAKRALFAFGPSIYAVLRVRQGLHCVLENIS